MRIQCQKVNNVKKIQTHCVYHVITLLSACTPIQFWALIRHGTRYPDPEEIESFANLESTLQEIIANYEEGKTALCQEDFDLLKT